MIENIFITVVKMSLTSSYIILFVLVIRLLLKKSPKIFSYMLWAVVFFRLISPITIESKLSLIPNNPLIQIDSTSSNSLINYSDYNLQYTNSNSTIKSNTITEVNDSNTNNKINSTNILAILWISIVTVMISYSIFSLIKLNKKLKTSRLIRENIYECSNINTAFVNGIFDPKIYIPNGISKNEEQYILAHERIHIKRYDYIIKLIGYFIVCIHFFNPLVWISFILMSRDMEMSCDEAVIKELGNGIKKDYSKSLLAFATNNREIKFSPIAFGEGDVKNRIKNVLRYRKPNIIILVISIIVLLFVGVGLIVNPSNDNRSEFLNIDRAIEESKERNEIFFRVVGDSGYIWSGENFAKNFEKSITDIEEHKIKLSYELTEDIIVYIDKSDEYKLSFYKSHPNIMKVSYDGKDKYYISDNDIYSEINLMVLLINYRVPEETIKVITEGKKTNRTSYNDQPYIDYLVLDLGEGRYYIYEEKGKYYLEQPYVAIYEISKDIYNNAMQYASQPKDDIDETSSNLIKLSNFKYTGDDIIEKLIYDTTLEETKNAYEGDFNVVAAKIFGSYEEEDKIKIFATIYIVAYKYNSKDKIVEEDGGGIVPIALTYTKNQDGSYTLEEYLQSRDGSFFEESIREFCTMPVSGKKINGLADKIINGYTNYDNLKELQRENLIKHLEANNQRGVSLLVRGYDEPDIIIALTKE